MTVGKKADSAIPRNHLRANIPPKFCAAAARRVKEPKQHIIMGKARDGP